MKIVIGANSIIGALTFGIVGTFLGLSFGAVTGLYNAFPLSPDAFASFGAISLGSLGLVLGAKEDARDMEKKDELDEIQHLHNVVRTSMLEKAKTGDMKDTIAQVKEEKKEPVKQ